VYASVIRPRVASSAAAPRSSTLRRSGWRLVGILACAWLHWFHAVVNPCCSYYMALGILCGLVFAAMPWAAVGLSNQLGRARKENVTLARMFQ
jgi:hypothetical protein